MDLTGRRRRQARDLVASGWFDAEWYGLQVGLVWPTAEDAAKHYLDSVEGRSAHPLLTPSGIDQPAGLTSAAPPVLGDVASASPPAAASLVSTSFGAVRWSLARPALLRALARWRAGEAVLVPGTEPARASTTVILAVAGSTVENSTDLLGRWVGEHRADDPEGTRLVIVLAGGDVRHLQALAVAALAAGRGWTLLAAPSPDLPAAVRAALDTVSTPWTVIWPGYARPERGWLPALQAEAVTAAEDVAVLQPIVVQRDGTIASAGGVRSSEPGAVPVPAFRGRPVEDVRRVGGLRAPTAVSPVIAVRTAQLRAAGGLDPRLVGGLAETAVVSALAPGAVRPVVVVGDSRVLGRAQGRYGFVGDRASSERVLRAEYAESFSAMPDHPEPRALVVRPDQPWPRLRWAIDTAAPVGDRGRRWGDRIFAESLARALEALGQDVAVDTKASRQRESRQLDDVVLVLRGLDRVEPVPGRLNLLWVISHPEDVSEQECRGFDAVLAASSIWARDRLQQWGIPVTPLMQCTDPEVFHPSAARGTAPRAVFVGNSRGVMRPVLDQALQVGLRPAVYGSGWSGLVDDDLVVGDFVDPAQCAALYAGSDLVLNDHWDDMRRDGFVSNRVFDVLACGGRLVTDDVAGLAELGLAHLAVVENADDWADVLHDPLRVFGTASERMAQASRVATDHSFAARARSLLELVCALRRPDS